MVVSVTYKGFAPSKTFVVSALERSCKKMGANESHPSKYKPTLCLQDIPPLGVVRHLFYVRLCHFPVRNRKFPGRQTFVKTVGEEASLELDCRNNQVGEGKILGVRLKIDFESASAVGHPEAVVPRP